ncbi:MAG TPA: hypothetical protein VK986_21475 [Tepidisphaeraceae bacterium]|nr:hypothetical protein [Tepidisphaeraceae bacterium]
MVNIRCSVGVFKSGVRMPRLVSDGGFTLQDAFFFGSGEQVNVQVWESGGGPMYHPDLPADDFLLNDGANRLLGTPVIRPGRLFGVDHVGLLIADRYRASPGAFGVMFDRGFEPVFNGPSTRVPRRCCAVFVNAIAAARPAAEFENECYYTAAHELGHVFNLRHAGRGFMRTSHPSNVYPATEFQFFSAEMSRLRQCDVDHTVCPGGSDFYAGVPTNEPAAAGRARPAKSKTPPPLYDPARGLPKRATPRGGFSLEINARPDVFFPFEPVELDVTLRTSSATPVDVPDQLHPGYERFAVFVTAPDGSRARYAPVVHHCDHGRVATVARNKPHTVDLTLFGQSGGYTFSRPGFYQIQALFRIPSGRAIASNVEQVEVRPVADPKGSAVAETARRVMTDPGVAKFLFYRSPGLIGPAERRLEAYVDAHPKYPSIPAAHYALGACLMRAAEHRPRAERTRLRKRAHAHLRRAVQSKGLKGHRCEKAEHLLAVPVAH